MMYWVAIVDGECYGFFKSEQHAKNWTAREFPVAFAQENFRVYEFIHAGVNSAYAEE